MACDCAGGRALAFLHNLRCGNSLVGASIDDLLGGGDTVFADRLARDAELLAPEGRLGFIVPNKFLKHDYGAGLRRMLSADRLVDEIIDFGDAQLFEGATNYTAILILSNAGHDGLQYRRFAGSIVAVRRALVDVAADPAESFSEVGLGKSAWILATGLERRVLDALRAGSEPLESVTSAIFTGLQTSADRIYIVEDRGWRGANRLVWSKASKREIQLEPSGSRGFARH